MCKISWKDFRTMMQTDVVKTAGCIEVEFSVDGDPAYSCCWLGKMPDKTTGAELFWHGLVPGESQAYDHDTLEAFLEAEVFHGRSIKQAWDNVPLHSIDACPVEDRLSCYLGLCDEPEYDRAKRTP